MKNVTRILVIFLSIAWIAACSENPVEQDGTANLVVTAFDAPLNADAEAVWLDIDSVSVHRAEPGEEESGEWIGHAVEGGPINFLDLVNGNVTTLLDAELEAGMYSQLRLVLGPDNSITINGENSPLMTPSGQESGVKLNLQFELAPGELVELYVDFDAAQSVVEPGTAGEYANQGDYILKPVFKAWKKTISGTIAGQVADDEGTAVENTTLYFVTPEDDSTSTITDANGAYLRHLPEGTYSVTAIHSDFTSVDTSYTDVSLAAGESLIGYDFVLSP